MKKLLVGLIATGLLISCNNSKNIYDLKQFCDYTIASYKNDNTAEAIALRIKKDALMNIISSMTMPEADKKQELEATQNRATAGYFDQTRLEKAYSDFRTLQDNEFWENCVIEAYKYLEIEDFFGYEMAEPMVVLKYGDKTVNFKIGELIKTDNGWKILGAGPAFK